MRILHPSPITLEAYSPYGALVSARASPAREANHGIALAWDDLATLESRRDARARATASLFRCLPQPGPSFLLERLERHPHSTQLFAPMTPSRFVVTVALGADEPDLSTLAAFVVEGPVAVAYAPGVWHHPIVGLARPIDFVNIVSLDGSDADCEELALPAPIELRLPSP